MDAEIGFLELFKNVEMILSLGHMKQAWPAQPWVEPWLKEQSVSTAEFTIANY